MSATTSMLQRRDDIWRELQSSPPPRRGERLKLLIELTSYDAGVLGPGKITDMNMMLHELLTIALEEAGG